jgi:hypothetical protein
MVPRATVAYNSCLRVVSLFISRIFFSGKSTRSRDLGSAEGIDTLPACCLEHPLERADRAVTVMSSTRNKAYFNARGLDAREELSISFLGRAGQGT